MKLLIFIHLLSNSFLLAIIYQTQLITYPTFLEISPNKFNKYHKNYVNVITYLVAPFMFIELSTLVVIIYNNKGFLLIKSLLTLIVIWLVTFIVMVPIHNNISKKYESSQIRRLINYNWIRTVLWTLKFIVVFYILYYEII